VTISLAASSRNSSSFGNEAIRDQFAVGFAPLEKSGLLHAAQAAGFSVKEMTEVGLASRPRGGGPLQDRFRGRLMFPACDMQREHGRADSRHRASGSRTSRGRERTGTASTARARFPGRAEPYSRWLAPSVQEEHSREVVRIVLDCVERGTLAPRFHAV
jgi:hypothetical protein